VWWDGVRRGVENEAGVSAWLARLAAGQSFQRPRCALWFFEVLIRRMRRGGVCHGVESVTSALGERVKTLGG
jgi:hypothetical protein